MFSTLDIEAFDINSFPFTRGPIFLEIHPTNICNSVCVFCNQRHFRTQHNQIDYAFLISLLDELTDKGLRVLRISGGGEPTIYPHILDLLDYIRQKKIILSMFNTNGILLNKELIVELTRVPTKTLYLSLQAPNSQSWNKITGQPSYIYDRIINSIQMNVEFFKETSLLVSYVLHEDTYEDLESGILLCKKNNWDVNIVDLNNYSYSSAFLSNIDKVVEKLKTLKQLYNKIFYGFENIPELLPISDCGPQQSCIRQTNTLSDQQICLAPWFSSLIRPNGEVFTCCALGGKNNCIGNIYNTDFTYVWNSQKSKAIKLEAISLFFNQSKDYYHEYMYLSNQCLSCCPVQIGCFSNPEIVSLIREKIR